MTPGASKLLAFAMVLAFAGGFLAQALRDPAAPSANVGKPNVGKPTAARATPGPVGELTAVRALPPLRPAPRPPKRRTHVRPRPAVGRVAPTATPLPTPAPPPPPPTFDSSG